MVQEQLKSKGVEITIEQAFVVARSFEDKMWYVHTHLGYGLALLFIARIFIEVISPCEEKVYSRVKKAAWLSKNKVDNASDYKHYIWVKRGYLLFYAFLFIMIITGIGLALGRDISFLGKIHRVIKEIHSVCQMIIYAFVLLHLLGVIIIENSNAKAIVSGMINGNK
jgi:Ni/Fe-hydrogenase 1 B-type cytochrome subunit